MKWGQFFTIDSLVYLVHLVYLVSIVSLVCLVCFDDLLYFLDIQSLNQIILFCKFFRFIEESNFDSALTIVPIESCFESMIPL
jgi:hypothetical protein